MVSGAMNGHPFYEFAFMGREVRFFFEESQREDAKTVLRGYFLREPYKELNVVGRDVLDIGANVGDTSIYFALRGARKVIALEPYLHTFNQARFNISYNGFEDRILLLNEGAGRTGWLLLDQNLQSTRSTPAVVAPGGTKVRFNSLKELVDRFSLQDAVLKINCEGCEQELLLDSDKLTLRSFVQIGLEYHGDYSRISKRLDSAGFKVRLIERNYANSKNSNGGRAEYGLVHARRALS